MRRDPGRRRLVVGFVAGLLVVVLVISVAGGPVGDDGSTSSATTTSAPRETIPIAPEDRPFCEAFGALLSGPLSDPATDTGDPTAVEAAIAATEVVLDELVAAAPGELADPIDVLVAQFRAAFELFERYGFDVDRVLAEATPEEQAVLDAFGGTGTDADDAMVPIEEFVVARCSTEPLPDLGE